MSSDYVDTDPEAGAVLMEDDHDGLVLVNLSTVEPQQIDWLWPGRWPRGKLSLVVGDPDLGKSFLLLDAAARISTGADWPDGGAAPQGVVLLMTAEDGLADTIVPRLKAMGADRQYIVAVPAVRVARREAHIELDVHLEYLEAVIIELQPIAVMIDPITAYLGATESNSDASVRALLGPLAQMAERHNVAIIAIKHLNKASHMSAKHRVGGSIGFLAAPRSVFTVAKDPQNPERRLFVVVKLNIATHPPALAYSLEAAGSSARVVWHGAVEGVDAESLLRDAGPKTHSAVDTAKDWLREALADGDLPATELYASADDEGITERTLKRAKAALQIRSKRRMDANTGDTCSYWLQIKPVAE